MNSIIMTLENIEDIKNAPEECSDVKDFWEKVYKIYYDADEKSDFYILGKSHCIACGHEQTTIAPWPVGVNPNMRCLQCDKLLVVFDEADELKIKLTKQ